VNAEEVHLPQAAREIIKQKLAAENLEEDVVKASRHSQVSLMINGGETVWR
jgi:hypothetical protein